MMRIGIVTDREVSGVYGVPNPDEDVVREVHYTKFPFTKMWESFY